MSLSDQSDHPPRHHLAPKDVIPNRPRAGEEPVFLRTWTNSRACPELVEGFLTESPTRFGMTSQRPGCLLCSNYLSTKSPLRHSGPRLECPLRGRKRPWHRRSSAGAWKASAKTAIPGGLAVRSTNFQSLTRNLNDLRASRQFRQRPKTCPRERHSTLVDCVIVFLRSCRSPS